MEKTGTDHHALFLLLTNTLIFLVLISSAIASPNGFTMKLVHRDSIESPFYPGNLTREETIRRLGERSEARLRYLTSSNKVAGNYSNNYKTSGEIDPDSTTLATIFEGMFYMALVGIGTFPGQNPDYKNYYLLVDSGSELIWTQCFGSEHSFYQKEPLFPKDSSSSYHPLPCNTDPPCPKEHCRQGQCHFDKLYATGSRTQGLLATERFSLTSNDGSLETFDNIIFGCGLDQVNFGEFLNRPGVQNEITGIMGIGGGRKSLLTQLGNRGGGRFSYCLQPYTAGFAINTFLRFGEDADIQGGRIQSTPLAFAGSNPVHYYINLYGISVGNQVLPIPIEWLRMYWDPERGSMRGGCLIDSGSPWTYLHEPVYLALQNAIMSHFEQIGMVPIMGVDVHPYFKLCYFKQPNFWKYPIIKFHFQGQAVFTMDQNNAFYIEHGHFCLAFVSASDDFVHVLFGAWQMTNHRILYDVWNNRLSFAQEDCHLGS